MPNNNTRFAKLLLDLAKTCPSDDQATIEELALLLQDRECVRCEGKGEVWAGKRGFVACPECSAIDTETKPLA